MHARAQVAMTLLLVGMSATPVLAAGTRVEQILERLTNANANRDHVMVVAHRGSWWQGGEVVLAENSLSAIDRAVEIGAEMVELDVQKTADGRYVVIHDETLDRTTTCEGPVAEHTLDEIRACNLVIGLYHGPGEVVLGVETPTDEVVPTLEEVFEAIDGRILMNVDIKLGVEELVNVTRIAEEVGVADQLVIKNVTNTPQQLEAARATLDAIEADVVFMPILDDAELKDLEPVINAYEAFAPEAIEVLNRWEPGTPITEDGGLHFSVPARALAIENDTHLWMNVLWQGMNARISGGRGDPIAVGPGLVHEGWGFWAEAGATILQTDEPEALIAFLEAEGLRRAYAQ